MSKNVLFFGTPKIARSVLEGLLEITDINVVGVVTKIDKPVGRNKENIFSEVKKLALEKNIPLFQPNKLIEIKEKLLSIDVDLAICCAYGNLIPQSILDIPKYKCINIHTSLLPRWRGGAPIHWAVISGDKKTGITFMYMDKGLDTGNIIEQFSVDISPNDTYRTVYDKLAKLAYEKIKDKVNDFFRSNVKVAKQDDKNATYANNITPEIEKINWNTNGENIINLIHGLFDEPIAYSVYENQRIKIYDAFFLNEKTLNNPGTITNISKEGIKVSCNNGTIVITKLQIPGKKPISVKELINGKHFFKIEEYFF